MAQGGPRLQASPSVPADPRVATAGHALRQLRRQLNITQETLAARSGVPIGAISELEAGRRDVRLSTMLRICEGLDMTAAEVLGHYDTARRVTGDVSAGATRRSRA